jgi:ribokinase
LINEGDIEAEIRVVPGGAALNISVWARAQDCPTRLVGKVGHDYFGQYILKFLKMKGIDSAIIAEEGAQTGLCVGIVSAKGDKTLASSRGANTKIHFHEIDLKKICDSNFLQFSAYWLTHHAQRSVLRRLITIAREHNIPYGFSMCPHNLVSSFGRERLRRDINGCKLLFLNILEAKVLTGFKSLEHIVSSLIEICEIPVITLGGKGCIVVEGTL